MEINNKVIEVVDTFKYVYKELILNTSVPKFTKFPKYLGPKVYKEEIFIWSI